MISNIYRISSLNINMLDAPTNIGGTENTCHGSYHLTSHNFLKNVLKLFSSKVCANLTNTASCSISVPPLLTWKDCH